MNIEEIRKTHTLTMQDRKEASLSGIREVENFHESEIVLISECGSIAIEGTNLKIDSFSVESGKISITGEIDSLSYFEKPLSGKGSLFSRRVR